MRAVLRPLAPHGMLLAATGAAGFGLLALRPDRLSLAGALCLVAALLVAAVPPLLAMGRRQPTETVPILWLSSAFYVLFFILPPFLLDVVWPDGRPIRIYGMAPIIPGIDSDTGLIVLLGIGAFVLGLTVAQVVPGLPRLRLDAPSPRRLAWTARGFLALHAAFWLFPALRAIPSFDQLWRPSGALAFGLMVAAVATRSIGRGEALVVFGLLLPLRLLAGVMTASLNNSLLLVFSLGVLAVSLNRRLMVPCLAAILALALLYTPVQIFRWSGQYAQPGEFLTMNRLSLLFTAWDNPKAWVDKAATPFWHVAKRLDQATVLTIVVDTTGSSVEPWNGTSLINLMTGMVPRAIWPGKPQERFGYEFGLRYGLIQPIETNMSVNLPWLTEFYANFRQWGVGLGLLAVGLVLGLANRSLNPAKANPVEAAFAATLLVPLLLPESNISLMTSNLPLIGLALWLPLRLGLGGREK